MSIYLSHILTFLPYRPVFFPFQVMIKTLIESYRSKMASTLEYEVNEILKDVIGTLSRSFDVVLIDGGAGVEQINRMVMKNVDYLVVVSDSRG